MRLLSFTICFLVFAITSNAQLPKWILASSEQNSSGVNNSYGTGNLKFYEVNFKGGLTSTPRTIGTSIQNIKCVGAQDIIQTAVDTNTNTVLFYVVNPSYGQWNGGFPPISPDTFYFAAFDPNTGADEVFAKTPSDGWGASVIEAELVQKPGSATEYYFIYKTQATSNSLDNIKYVTVDISNKSISSPTNLVTATKSGEGLAVSQLNCNNQRWLFVTRPESNGNITLRQCSITNTGITPAVDIYTISIPGNSTNVVVGVEIAPTNNYLAVANYNNVAVSKNMILFDYDNNTGLVSNERAYKNQSNQPFVTMEFSPNSSRVYILQGGGGSVPNLIYNCPVSATNYTVTAANQVGGLSLNQSLTLETAYDGNIYVNPGQSSNFMYVINNPNSATPTVTSTSTNFFGAGNMLGSGFPDQVDGDKYASSVGSVSISATNTVLCAGQTATLTASGASNYQWSGGSTATTSVIVVNPVSTTTYVVSGTSGTCTGGDTVVVQVSPTPTVTISGNQNICSGQTTTLTASGASSYQWSGGSTATTSVIVVNPSFTTNYTVTPSNGSCAGNPVAVTVSVTPSPTLSITGNQNICSGQSTTLTVSGASTYQWSGGGTATTSVISVSPATTTTYVVVGSNGSCNNIDSVVVQVTANPTVTISGNQNICAGQSTTLTASGASSYQWSGGSTATTPSIVVSPSSTTNYTVTGSNGSCSGAPVAIIVSVTPTPTITVTGNQNLCSGQTTTLTASGANSYQWSGGSTATTSVITVSPATTTTYVVTGSNGTCNNTYTAVVVVTPTPTITVSGNQSICSGQSTTLTASGASTYQWSGGSTATTSVIVINPSTTTSYTVAGVNGSCPGNPVAVTVSVTPSPTVTVAGIQNICSGQSTTLTASGATSYQWSGGSTATGSVITVSPNATTSYTVAGTTGACPAQSSVTVTVIPTPTVSISATSTVICAGQSATLSVSGGGNYQWSGGSTSTSSVIVVAPSSSTSYTVISTNGNCTSAPASISVTVIPDPTVTVSGNLNICSGQSTTLTAGGGTSYQWSGGSSASSPTIAVTPLSNTSYTVVTTAAGCPSAPVSVTVNVTPTPTLSIAATTFTLCLGQTATLTASGGTSYQWSGGSTATSASIVVTPTVTTGYTVTSANGNCTGAATVTLPVVSFTQAQFTYSITPCIPPTVSFNNLSAAAVLWYFGDGTGSQANDPTHGYAPGTYTASMVTNAGTICADSASQEVAVFYYDHEIIPNIFTPNGDSINDELIFSGIDPCTEYELTIYNRWGQKVFETNTPQTIYWKGKLNDKNADDGTYYFLLVPKNSTHTTYKGHVTLIR